MNGISSRMARAGPPAGPSGAGPQVQLPPNYEPPSERKKRKCAKTKENYKLVNCKWRMFETELILLHFRNYG